MTNDPTAAADNQPEPDDPAESTSRTTAIIGALTLAAVAVVGLFFVLRTDDSDSVSTGSDPAAESSAPLEAEAEQPDDVPLTTDEPAADEPADESVATITEESAAVVTEPPVQTDAPSVEPAATEPAATEPPPEPVPETATYRVMFDANWVAATHPSTLPSNAHFSDPVIAVHEAPGALFTPGQVASPGTEEMAEAGRTSALLAELGANSGVAFAADTDGIDAPAMSTRTFDITVSQAAPLLSFVTMLAPSPDWFVGFGDMNTFVDGQWIDTVTFDVGSYDAGTDSGSDFSSGNADSDPADPIAGPRDPAFVAATAEGAFGTITITKTG